MQTNTALGVGLGQLIASAFNPGNQGTLDGIKANETLAKTRLYDARRMKAEQDAADLAEQSYSRSDSGIMDTLLKASGAGGKTAVNDFKAYLEGGKLPSTALPGSASALLDGSNTIEPTYVKRFPQLAQRYGALRESLMLGNKDPDKMEQAIGQGQRNRLTENITPQNVIDVAQMVAAHEGKDPTKVVEANLTNRLANGGDYGTIAPAILASKGKGMINESKNLKYDSARGVLIDPGSGTAKPVTMPNGQPLPSKAKEEKPLPVQAVRLQDENLDAISSVSSINADLGAFVKQIDSGALNLGVLSNALSGVKNFAGMSDEQSRNLQSFKATLEKMRNTSLLLNKGVQTDGDAQRAWNELLTNINDPRVVRQRLVEIQSLNEHATKLRMARNNTLRRNFGAADMDYTPYLATGAAIGGEKQPTEQVPSQQRQVVRTGTLNGKRVVQFSDGSVQYAE